MASTQTLVVVGASPAGVQAGSPLDPRLADPTVPLTDLM
jgi:hypothetical protein